MDTTFDYLIWKTFLNDSECSPNIEIIKTTCVSIDSCLTENEYALLCGKSCIENTQH